MPDDMTRANMTAIAQEICRISATGCRRTKQAASRQWQHLFGMRIRECGRQFHRDGWMGFAALNPSNCCQSTVAPEALTILPILGLGLDEFAVLAGVTI